MSGPRRSSSIQHHLFVGNDSGAFSSSLTMVMAVSASARRETSKVRKWILATALLGVTFIVLHMIEWRHLIAKV